MTLYAAVDSATVTAIIALLYPPLLGIGGALVKMNRKINAAYQYVDPNSSTTSDNEGRTLPARVAELEKAKVESDHRLRRFLERDHGRIWRVEN